MSAWSERYAELREEFHCEHETTRHTKRTVAGGAIQYVDQCTRCGKATTQAIARKSAIAANGGIEPDPFDDDLHNQWNEARGAAYGEVQTEIHAYLEGEKNFLELQSQQWHKKYREYQKSPEWAALKDKVLMRAQGICEGCREAKATVLHHLTYDHVFNELLFELVALCGDCHHRAHTRSNRKSAP
jgi:hypothetical protein